MAHSAKLPRELAIGDGTERGDVPSGIYAGGALGSSGGISIIIIQDKAPPRPATVGVFICIDQEYYGLTASHEFSTEKPTHEDSDAEDLDVEFGDSSSLEDSSDEEESLLELTSKGYIYA